MQCRTTALRIGIQQWFHGFVPQEEVRGRFTALQLYLLIIFVIVSFATKNPNLLYYCNP
jgi:hypothetical protein